ncbi:hypothetical protein E4U54_003089 [Claviceps lovelessii]|nr:hypothetical protein E4U54_003089 [Claviceps lovelessii]
MENGFLYLNTWRGHVLVFAALLQPSAESTDGSLTYPDCSPFQDQIALTGGHGINMGTSGRPVPDFWQHQGQSEALINTVCGPDYLASPPPPTRPTRPTRPTLTSVKPLSSNCTSFTSCTSLADRDDVATMASPAGTGDHLRPSPLTPWLHQYLHDLQHAQLLQVGIHMFFQPSPSSGHEQAPKRRRLSPSTPLAQYVYDTPGASDGNSRWLA